jgi:hypothetical protein
MPHNVNVICCSWQPNHNLTMLHRSLHNASNHYPWAYVQSHLHQLHTRHPILLSSTITYISLVRSLKDLESLFPTK